MTTGVTPYVDHRTGHAIIGYTDPQGHLVPLEEALGLDDRLFLHGNLERLLGVSRAEITSHVIVAELEPGFAAQPGTGNTLNIATAIRTLAWAPLFDDERVTVSVDNYDSFLTAAVLFDGHPVGLERQYDDLDQLVSLLEYTSGIRTIERAGPYLRIYLGGQQWFKTYDNPDASVERMIRGYLASTKHTAGSRA